jgi:hypothetical protein
MGPISTIRRPGEGSSCPWARRSHLSLGRPKPKAPIFDPGVLDGLREPRPKGERLPQPDL